jgi:hypothetical protein
MGGMGRELRTRRTTISVSLPSAVLESNPGPRLTGLEPQDRTYREQPEVSGMGKGRGHIDQQVDQYWRTRTINEAQLQEYTSLRLICGCGRITDYPFTLLLQRRGVTRYSFLGNIRFRCKDCGGKDITISVRSQAPPGEQ